MSTMDYLEFKEHIEHAFTQADRAKEYKKQSQESINRSKQSQALISKLADINAKSSAVLSDMNEIKNTKAGDDAYFTARYYKKNNAHGNYKSGVGSALDATRKISANNIGAHASANSGLKSLRDSLASFLKSASASTIDPYKLTLIKNYYNTISKSIDDKSGHVRKNEELYQAVSGLTKLTTSTVSHSNLEHASRAGMPTNLKQESSNIKRASERAKFMNQLQQVCDKIRVNNEQLTNLQKANFDTYNDPVRGNGRKTGGGYTGAEEINKLRWKYSKENNPLLKQLHNLLNAGKNSPLFTDAEKEKMRKWMQGGGTLDELATVYSDIFGSVSHDSLEHASIAGVPSRLRSKMQDAIYKKTGYQSKGSYAGAPSNAKQATADQNKAVANARFSASIKSAIEACNRDAAEAQSVYVEATTRINNIVSRSRGEVNSIIRSVNEYNENVRNIRKQTITKKSTFATVANGKMYQGVRDEQVPVDPNRQFISFSAGAQKISANKYVYKPKMLLIDSDPGTYKEV